MRRNRWTETSAGTRILSGCCVLAFLLICTGPAAADAPGERVNVDVLSNASGRIVLDYDVNNVTFETVLIDGKKHTQVKLGKESPRKITGAPQLPNVCRSIQIPDDAHMKARIISSKFYEIEDVNVMPSKGILMRTVNPADVPYTFGPQYQQDEFFPADLVELKDPYILRDIRGQLVVVNPVQYNPISRVLRVYTKVQIEVVADGPGKVNVLDRSTRSTNLSRSFDKLYGWHFINYAPTLRYTPLDETGSMLIICYDSWLSNIQPLVNHKNSRGIPTTAVGVSTIGNNSTSIKTYIQNLYNSSDLAFVLLVGDYTQVATPSASGGASDPTYSKLAGNDNYPEIFVGRFSAESAGDVDTQVTRTIEYETLPAPTQDWWLRATGIASDEGTGDDGEYDYEHMDNIRTDLLAYGFSPVDQIYDPGASASSVATSVNAGRGFINYVGHGDTTYWSTTGFSNTNVNALTNVGKLPVVYSVACVNGEFDGPTCFGEAWLRATYNGQPTGAVAAYMSSINQSWDPPMCAEDEYVDRLVDESYVTFGGLCYASCCQMMDEYYDGHVEGDGSEMFNTWHIFGDPSLKVLVSCTPAGVLSIDRETYACEDQISISLNDCDLNLDDGSVDTASVTVTSTSDAVGQVVLLTETDPASSQFMATLTISSTVGSGILLVAEGDTITAEYIDADDGAGGLNVSVTDTGVVDCTPPVISNIRAIDIEPRSANVTLDANEPVKLTVYYGTSCGSLTQTASSGALSTTPIAGLAGLQDEVTYFYTVEVADEAGNVTTSDNGGNCYMFTTPPVPDYFTEIFESGDNDLDDQTFMFTPNGSNDFYEGCVEPITELPTDPTGGTAITFGGDDDDGYQQITLTGGATVQIYGMSYGAFYVGTNGYITFTHGEDSTSESLSTHFSQPAISGLFDDLDPGAAGSVSWKQLADRAVVTWLNVPKFNTTNSNTFQIEMFFDGTIVLSYLTVSITDGLAGLSAGDGLDPEYYETDLTTLGNCGPKPPKAYGAQYSTPVNQNLQIGLVATDDGLPEDPGILTYIITSLPEYGVLIDAGASYEITAGDLPYTLINHDNAVIYDPDFWSFESDSFTFVADDGGTIPDESGWSNEALISISIQAPAPELVYEWTLDTDPGWVCDGLWGFGVPLGLGSHNDDPSSGYTGSNVYGYNLYGDYANNMSEMFLTTTAIDCSALTSVQLQFRRWLGVESSDFDHAKVEVSNDGSTWHTIWEHDGNLIAEVAWSLQTYDISAYADGEETVYVRWCMGATDDRTTYPGWNIDDVEIHGIVSCATIVPCDTNGDGFVNGADISGFVGVVLDPDDATLMVRCAVDVVADGEYDMLDVEEFVSELLQ